MVTDRRSNRSQDKDKERIHCIFDRSVAPWNKRTFALLVDHRALKRNFFNEVLWGKRRLPNELP